MYFDFLLKKRYLIYILIISYIIMCQSCMKMQMSNRKTRLFFETSKIIFQDKTVNFTDFNIHYLQTGNQQNPTLLFIHGSPGSWDAYKMYLKDSLLLKKYRLIAIDRPGFGTSNFGQAENLKIQAQRLNIFVKSISNNSPIILIGHSMGGPVQVKMAILEPNLYEHLVILAGAIDPDAEKPEMWRSIIMKKPIRYLIPGALRPANDELWWLKQDLIDMKQDLKKVISKITIIHGTKDQLVPYSNVAFMNREFVNSKATKIISIPNANHFIPWEHFELIRNTLETLID